MGAFHPAPLPLGACGAYTTAVGAGPPRARRAGGWARQGVGSRSSYWPLGPPHPPFFPLKDPAAPGGPAGGGTGPGSRPGGRSGGTNAARGGLQPSSGAAAARSRYCAQEQGGLGGAWSRAASGTGPEPGCVLTLRPPPPPAANSPPGGGPGTLPALPAPIGVNGFGPLTPQTNGQPGSDTLYNSGLSPYPGGPLPSPPPRSAQISPKWSGERGDRVGRTPWEGTSPCYLLPLTPPCSPARLHRGPHPSLPSPEPRCG